MEPWQVLVALIQGTVEWLPISSEGQAVLFLYNFTSVPPDEMVGLVIWLHLGTAMAVVARYPREIRDLLLLRDRALLGWLVVATVCTAVTAIPLYLTLKTTLMVTQGELVNVLVGALLLITALMLYLPTRQQDESVGAVDSGRGLTGRIAAVTGLVQGLAVLPGLSRSGVTVSALLMQRVDKETALRFSFLMSVPAVLGVLALDVMLGAQLPASVTPVDMVVMECIVFATGLLSMEALLRVARRVSFWKLCVFLALVAILFGLPALF